MGPAGSDNVLQTLQMPSSGSVFGGVGSYPLEGGYIYITPVGFPTYVYKHGKDANGLPYFTQVSETTEKSSGRVGVGIPTITTFQGQPGTAIYWQADIDGGLRAYKAVPEGEA
jgi:iron transport multicopper oxidase